MLSKGYAYEKLAEKYLCQQGYKIKSRNFRIRKGEIDLIALDNNTLVFVEVRFRKNSLYGSPEETITRQKQTRIILTAQHYMTKFNLWNTNARFDVITIQPTAGGDFKINWLKNAFS